MYRRLWILDFPATWYQTYRLKRLRVRHGWTDRQYYREMYSLPRLTHAIEGDKFTGLRASITAEVGLDRESSRVLDLATGRGYQARHLWDHGYRHVYGCDVVEDRVRQARLLHAGTGLEWFVADLTRTAMPSGAFDAITVSVALHDVAAKDLKAILEEAVRILRVGGRLIVLEPRHVGDIRTTLARWVYPSVADVLDESVHMKDFVSFDLAQCAADVGLALTRRQILWHRILCLYSFEKTR
jgi:ubiquinone/menaquinone biosynthesis C-methylase UbiE